MSQFSQEHRGRVILLETCYAPAEDICKGIVLRRRGVLLYSDQPLTLLYKFCQAKVRNKQLVPRVGKHASLQRKPILSTELSSRASSFERKRTACTLTLKDILTLTRGKRQDGLKEKF